MCLLCLTVTMHADLVTLACLFPKAAEVPRTVRTACQALLSPGDGLTSTNAAIIAERVGSSVRSSPQHNLKYRL